MLNDEQIKIADFLLTYLADNGGKSSQDDYPSRLRKQGFDHIESSFVPDFLREHLGLIDYWGDAKYWIRLTPEGYEAAKPGLKKYLDEIEKDKALEKENIIQSISGVKSSKKASTIAIFLSLFVPFSLFFLQIYLVNVKHSTYNGNDYSSITANQRHSNFPNLGTDTAFIKKFADFLKHDTGFLNEIRKNVRQK